MRPLTTAFSFYILRHGETDSNAANIIQGSSDVSRLTANGKSQAMAVGQMALSPETTKRIDQIFISPLTRAHETLSLIRENAEPYMLPSSVVVLPNLREIDFYSWENQTKETLKAKHPKEYAAWKNGDPDGLVVDGRLPLHETWARAEQVWKEIREQSTTSTTPDNEQEEEETAKLIICHGTLGQALLGSAFGKDATTFRQHVFPNCGIAEIVWHEGEDMAASWGWHNELCQV